MSRDAHQAVIRAAERTERGLKGLFDGLGNAEHPHGRVLRVYRSLRTNVGATLAQGRGMGERQAVRDLLLDTRSTFTLMFDDLLRQAADLGTAQAEAQVKAYDLGGFTTGLDTALLQDALGAWLGVYDAQAASVQAALALGADDPVIVGDEERAGLLAPSSVILTGTTWLALAAMWGFWWYVEGPAKRKGYDWWKQAVAAIDHRTTDCCLKVHGQAVPLDKDFQLVGSPAFAPHMDWSPFHYHCRTSIVLVLPEDAQDGLTDQMRETARDELEARAKFGRVRIWPAHGRSHR